MCKECRWYELTMGTLGACLLGEPCRFDEEDKGRPREDFPAYRFPLRGPDGSCENGEPRRPDETWKEVRAASTVRIKEL